MSQDDVGEEDAGSVSQDALTKNTLVADVQRAAESACIVQTDDDLGDVAKALSARRGVHVAAVVNPEGALAGIIPLRLLVDEIFLQVAPEEFLMDILDVDQVEAYARMVRAQTAGEMMQEPAYVTPAETIGDAFALMRERELEGLPIVDERMLPIGYLDRLELVTVWLKEHQADDGSPNK